MTRLSLMFFYLQVTMPVGVVLMPFRRMPRRGRWRMVGLIPGREVRPMHRGWRVPIREPQALWIGLARREPVVVLVIVVRLHRQGKRQKESFHEHFLKRDKKIFKTFCSGKIFFF